MKRNDTIMKVAAILFGRDPDGGPEKGWQAKLARALGMHKTAIGKTLELAASPVFDRKLADLVAERRAKMLKDFEDLETLEFCLRDRQDGRQQIWLVEIDGPEQRTRHAMFAASPAEVAAYYLIGDLGARADSLSVEIRDHGDYVHATRGDHTVRVSGLRVPPDPLESRDLSEERELVARRAVRTRQPIGGWKPGEIKRVDDYTIADLPELRWHFEQALKSAEKAEVGPERSALVSHSIGLRNLIWTIERKIGEKN